MLANLVREILKMIIVYRKVQGNAMIDCEFEYTIIAALVIDLPSQGKKAITLYYL